MLNKTRKLLRLFKFYSILFASMMAIWYSMSSEYSFAFFIFASISTISTIVICEKLNLVSSGREGKFSTFIRVLSYYTWIVKAVFLASLDVTRRVWSVTGSANSGFCNIKIPKTNQIGIVAFANSITLTPGTISVYLHEDVLIFHTLDTSLEKNLIEESGNMINRINKLIGYSEDQK